MQEELIVCQGIYDLSENGMRKEGFSLKRTFSLDNCIFNWIVLSHLMEQSLYDAL